jgi:hypothetical protein
MTSAVIFCPKHLKETLFERKSSSQKHSSNLYDSDELMPPYLAPDSLPGTITPPSHGTTTASLNYVDHDSYDNQIKSFYMMNLTKVHLSSSHNSFHLQDLIQKYPKMNPKVLERIYSKQSSWTACLDIISSLILSHGVMMMEVHPGEGVTDEEDWPLLQKLLQLSLESSSPNLPKDKGYEGGGDESLGSSYKITTSEDGWTLFEAIHLQPSRSDEWELLNPSYDQHEHLVEEKEVKKGSSFLSAAATAVGSSYKDILLRSLPSAEENDHSLKRQKQGMTSSAPWKPKIVIDKQLGKQVAQAPRGESSSLPSPTFHYLLLKSSGAAVGEDEDEEYDGYEVLRGVKSPAMAARSHSIHARISMKRSGMSLDKIRELRSKC